jgi:hypothetical protein
VRALNLFCSGDLHPLPNLGRKWLPAFKPWRIAVRLFLHGQLGRGIDGRAMILLAYRHGLRASELVDLQWPAKSGRCRRRLVDAKRFHLPARVNQTPAAPPPASPEFLNCKPAVAAHRAPAFRCAPRLHAEPGGATKSGSGQTRPSWPRRSVHSCPQCRQYRP